MVIEGIEIGGEGFVFVNFDYCFFFVGFFGGIVFVDSGNVWVMCNDVFLEDFCSGVGVGICYCLFVGLL